MLRHSLARGRVALSPHRMLSTTGPSLLRSTPLQQPTTKTESSTPPSTTEAERPLSPGTDGSHVMSIMSWAYTSTFDDRRGQRERSVVIRSTGVESSEDEGAGGADVGETAQGQDTPGKPGSTKWKTEIEVKDSGAGEDFKVESTGTSFKAAREGERVTAVSLDAHLVWKLFMSASVH